MTLSLTAFAVFLLLLASCSSQLRSARPIFVAFLLFDATRQWFKN